MGKLWAVVIVLAAACGDDAPKANEDATIDGDGGTTDAGGPPPTTYPHFGGIALAVARDTTAIDLNWVAATDDKTAPAAIKYKLYTGATAADVTAAFAAGTPVSTTMDTTHGELIGLAPDYHGYALVIAEDADGETSSNREPTPVSTSTVAPIVDKVPKVLADLGVTATVTAQDEFAISGAGVSGLAVGDIVIVDNDFGRTLREITAITATTMSTKRASLSEVFSQADLRFTLGMGDSPGTTTTTAKKAPVIIAVIEEGNFHPHFSRNARAPALVEVPGPENVTLDFNVTYEPHFEGEMKWTPGIIDTPNHLRFLIGGKLGVETIVAYNVEAEAELDETFTLFRRTVIFTYAIGPVPVLQTATFELIASVKMNASAKLEASMTGHMDKELLYGMEWDAGGGLPTFLNPEGETTKGTDFVFQGEASAGLEVTVFPRISTSLYHVATVEADMKPVISAEAHARALPLPIELDKLDIDFKLVGQIKADLTILGKELFKWESDEKEFIHVPLFSQIETKLIAPDTGTICHPVNMYLQATDGVSNKILASNISWQNTQGVVAADASGLTATLDAMTPGNYEVIVTANGDGFLPAILGRRTVKKTIVITDPGVPCDQVPPPTSGPAIACGGYNVMGLTGYPYANPKRGSLEVGTPFEDWAKVHVPLKWDTLINRVSFSWRRVNEVGMLGIPRSESFPNTGGGLVNMPYGDTWVALPVTDFGKPGTYVLSALGMDRLAYYPPVSCQNAGVQTDIGVYYSWERCMNGDFPGSTPLCPLPQQEHIAGPGWGEISVCDQTQVWSWASMPPHGACHAPNGIPPVFVELVGAAPPRETNDTTADADDLGFGQKVRGNLTPTVAGDPPDKDLFKLKQGGGPPALNGIFDADKPTPGCEVTVEAKTDVPVYYGKPRISIYRGEQNAANDTNRVIEGPSPIRFMPDPTEVYFAKVTSGGDQGGYTAEIKSDCTAATMFPSLTAMPTLTPPSLARGGTVTVMVPVDALTTTAYLSLVANDGSDFPAAGSGTISKTNIVGPTTLTFIVPTSSSAPIGTYVPRIELYDASGNHVSTYLVSGPFSLAAYAVQHINYVVGETRTESTIFTAPGVMLTGP